MLLGLGLALSLLVNVAFVLILNRQIDTLEKAYDQASVHSANCRDRWHQAEQEKSELQKTLKAVSDRVAEIAKIEGWHIVHVLAIAVTLLATYAKAQEVNPPPEDGGRCHLVVVTHDNPMPHERMLLDMLATDPNLVAIRRQCHFTHYTESNPLYRDRYAKNLGPQRVPAVVLQRADGGVLYLASGDNIPTSATVLFDQMKHFAAFDPQTWARDSVDASRMRTQSGSDCVGPNCPNPSRPALPAMPDRPDLSMPAGPTLVMPDSAQMLQSHTPVKNAGAAIVWAVGVIMFIFVMGFMGLVFLAALWIFSKIFK